MRYNPKMQEVLVNSDSSDDIGTILESHRAVLQLHCYRMTGSLHDAEDLVQETLLRAWWNYESFKGDSSLRTWLYRIATNVCLDALKKRRPRRRLRPSGPASDPAAAIDAPTDEVFWLEPYPDSELIDTGNNPEEQFLMHENISLAFLSLLQLLPPRQRAILILSDVLDWKMSEVAELLKTSVSAVESALHRARVTLAKNRSVANEGSAASTDKAEMKTLLDRFADAWEANDMNRLVSLLHEAVILSMPPFPAWYQGRDAVRDILSLHPFGQRRRAGWRLSPTRANGHSVFVLYRADQPGEGFRAFGLMVLSTIQSPGSISVSALTIFRNTTLITSFGFPPVAKFGDQRRNK